MNSKQPGFCIQVCKLGRYGAAFDLAGTHCAYTYSDQPDNAGAMKLGRAAATSAVKSLKSTGDGIDMGLNLLQALQDEGFGVFHIDGNASLPASGQPVFAIPDMDDHLLAILGRPNFHCSPIAAVLRLGGAEIKRKSEHEQAAVLHWMLTLYLRHGAGWWDVANAEIHRICDEHPAKPEAGA